MAVAKLIFTAEIFRFFQDLKKHNKKAWMDANRERYQETVSKPFRRLLEELSPALLKLDANFDVAAHGGRNFSRINRDIRFAKDNAVSYADVCEVQRAATRGNGGRRDVSGNFRRGGYLRLPHLRDAKAQAFANRRGG